MLSFDDLKKDARRQLENDKKREKTSTTSWESLKQSARQQNTIGIDQNYISSFFTDAQNYLRGASESYNGMGYANREAVFTSQKKAADDLRSRSGKIRAYLNGNKSSMKEDDYNSLVAMLDDFDKSAASIYDSFSKKNEGISQFKDEDEYNTAVKQWQEYYDQWGHYADETDFEEYAEKGAAVQNPTFSDAQGFGFGSWRFGNEDVGNIVTFSRDNYNDIVGYSEGGKYDVVGNLLYKNMTDDEVNLYNYLLAKEGKEAADSYLSYLEPQLKQTEGQRIGKLITDINIPVLEDLAVLGYGFGSGVDQWVSGTRQFFTNEEQSHSATQHANAYIAESLDGFGGYAHQAATTIGNMAPSILVSSVTAGLGAPAALAQGLGAATVGVSAAGNAYSDALSKGYDKGSARAYSTLVGAAEGVLQYLIGGVSKLGGMSGKLASKIAAIDNSLLRIAAKMGTSIGSEILEEELQNYLEPAFRTWIFGEEYDMPTLDELIETAVVTAMSTGLLESGGTIGGDIGNSKYYRSTYGNSVQDLVQQGLESPEGTQSHDLAAKYQAKLDAGKNLNGHQIGRMVEANEQQFRSEDISNIQNAAESRLTELGETGDVAAIASALTKQAAGEKLSRAEQQLISGSKYGQRVANELNTENIQSGDYSSEWAQKLDTNRINVQEYSRLVEAAQLPQETAEVNGDQVATEAQKAALLARDGSMPANDQQMTGKLTGKKSLHVDEDAVSADGQAEIGGNKVVLNGLKKAEDGSVVVATADNQSADPSEVKYPSKGHALVYENFANIETVTDNPVVANMDVETRSLLARAYNPAAGVSGDDYFFGTTHAYWYGFDGIPMNENTITKNHILSSITKDQRDLAYDLGRKAGKQAAETQEAGIHKAYEKAVEKLGGKGAAAAIAKKNPGKVVLSNGIVETAMTQKEQATYKLAKVVSKATGINIHIYRGVREYGKYNPNTGEIWLNINSNIGGSSLMAFTLAHELVHTAKQWKPADFRTFADYLFEQYGKRGVSVDALIREQMTKAKENGYTLNEHEAYEEVIADACQRMLLDSDAVQKMAAYKEQNPSNWQKIVDKIREFITSIRNLFNGAEPDSMEAALYKSLDEDAKQYLEKLFVDMVMGAGEHMSTIRNAFGKGTVVEVNADGEFTLAKGDVNGATKFLYNDSTWERGGRDTLKAALKAEGFSNEDINAALTIMDGKHKLVKELAEEFPEQARINQATVTTDLKTGHSVLSALVSNGDYPVNIDLLMVCKKRKAYQRVINRLCETGLIQQATVDALAIAEINKVLGKYGFETACLGCFVESRRLRIQEWANTIVKEWNAEVKKRNPDAKAFGFGKGKAKLTPDEVMQLIGELESGGEKNEQGNLNLGQGSAVKRMGALLDKVPSLRKTLSVEDLITPDGLTALRKLDSNLFSMVKSRYGSNSPKFVQEFNPYNHELAMYGKVPSEYNSLREYLYAIGGARMQSFSDFIVENWFDYCQIVADLAARKLPMHTYTKEISLAKLFGQTGIKINMSLIPDIDRSLSREFAGLTRNEKGEFELIWADKDRFKKTGGKSYMQSINFADAIALQNDPRYSSNVGTIAVGVSDKHIYMMLDDARIRMVIPYHSSGMNPIFADLMGTSYYKDYTMFQNTTVKQLYNSKGRPVSVKLDKTQTGKLTSGFQFNEVLQELGDARAAAQAYKDWCADASKHTITIKGETYTAELTPKFDSFSWHDNYYKLLEDFNTYDSISEEAAPQGDVQQIYPEDFDQILKSELTAQETHRQKQAENQAFDKAMGEIEFYLQNHTKADTVFYAEQHGVKLSAKDKKLGAEDKKKLADLRKGEKYSMPKKRTFTYNELVARGSITGEVIKSSDYVRMKGGLIDETWLVNRVKGDCKQKKTKAPEPTYYAEVPDIGRNVEVTRDGILHGGGNYKKNKKGVLSPAALINARITANIVNILRTSIEVNQSSRGSNIDVPITHIMLGVAGLENADGTIDYYAVRSEIQERANQDPILVEANVLAKLYAVNANKISSPHAQVTGGAGVALTTGSFAYNIADLLKDVKNVFDDTFSVDVYRKLKVTRRKNDFSENLLYKTTNSHGMSPRQLLADAFDELVQTPKERELMDQYRNNITKVEEVQERLRKLRAEISKLTKDKGDKTKLAELNKTAKNLAELIDKYDRKLLELEASKPLRDVLARASSAAYQEAKRRSEENMKEYRKQVSERFDRGVEGRRKTEMRKKIRKVIRDLDKILNRGDKKRNVKEDMKDFVAEALSAAEVLFTDNYTNEDIVRNGFGVELSQEEAKYLEEARKFIDELANLPAGGYDAWQARQEAEEKLKSKLAYRMGKLKDAFFRERQRLNKTEVAEVLSKLADSYAKLENSEYAYVNGAYSDAVFQYLKMLQEDVGGAKVKDMTLGQLEELYKAYTMVLTTVQNANKMFADDLKQSKEQLANRVMMEVHKAGGEHGLWSKGELARNQASWNNTKPIYAAERTGSPTFVKLVNGLFKGQYKWATDMKEAKAFRKKVAEKYGFKSWDMEKTYKFTSSSGIEFELNLNQIMSMYAYAKREKAHDHLLKGGFVFGKNTEVVVTKNGIKRTYLNKSAKAHTISDEIMGEIIAKMDEVAPNARYFVDEMQDYLSTTMGNKGNEVSMRLYGVKLFGEKFYFPLRSAGQFKEKAKEADLQKQQGQVRIVNSGFTHATKPKASNSVVLDGFTDVWASHVNEMSLYHSMVLPMEDYRRVYNYSSPTMEGQEPVSVNSTIENAYGDAATGYFDQLYNELNGGAIVDPRENWAKQMIGKFKKSAVLLSNSVVVQQFSAIGRAYALIDPKYFIGPKVDKKKHKVLWNEVKQYAPVAIIKEMGGFDTHTGLSARDYLLAEEYGKGERLKGIIKDEQYRSDIMGLLPAKADELTWCAIWEAVKRETKAKNPKMDVKSEEFLKKAGERFSEVIEKTQVYDSVLARSANMRSKQGLMQMLTAFLAEPTTTVNMVEDALRKGNKKTIARTFGAVAASIILNNALASLIYGMRDDDEDETFIEKYAQAFASGMLDDINPMTYYPILKDIWSLFQGYDVERTDMAIYSDIADSVKKVVVLIAKHDPETDDAAEFYKEIASALMGLLDAGAAWFGAPLKNVRRDLMSYYNTFKTFARGGGTTWNSFVDAVAGAALDTIPIVGLVAGDTKADKLYDAIISGDTIYANRLKGSYKDEKAVFSAMRSAIKDRFEAGDIDRDTAEQYLVEYGGLEEDDAYWKVDAWEYASDAGSSEDYSKYGDFYTAVETGKNLKAVIKEYTDNGVTIESLASQITSHFKPQYIAMTKSERASINGYLRNAMVYCGMNETDATERLRHWNFIAEFPGYSDLSESAVTKYYESVKSSGISVSVYYKYCQNKADYSKKDDIMNVINSLPITSAQKDALYLAEGWAASKIYEAPWH